MIILFYICIQFDNNCVLTTPTSMQTHNPYGGERWTNSNLTETESTLLNWVGKEKDHESKLGDHGVRKYEYETGRFISIDPLWGKYFGWTPYQYSMNSPVMLVDVNGEQPKVNNRYQDNLKDNTVYNRVFPQPTTCSSCTDYSTVGKNFLGLTYTGSENPKNQLKEETFNYKPKRLADYPSIGHDRRYNNLGAKGSESLFLDTRTIGADWQFVAEQMAISLGPGIPVTERMYSYLAGGLLGIAATPKTLFSMFLIGPALFTEHILYWYNESNEGVTNKPEEHKHEE